MSRKLLVFLIVAAVSVFAATASASAGVVSGNTGWTWSNPLPQGNSLAEIDGIGGRAYAAGESGTLMRSDNGGASWTGIRTGLLGTINVVRPVTPDVIVFASGCALRRTDDGGATVKRLPWGASDDNCAARIVSLSFPTSLIGYILLENGEVLTTTDGGDSWRKQTVVPGAAQVGGLANGVTDIAFVTPSNGVVSGGGKIFRTSDAGTSWTPVGPAIASATFDFIDANIGFALGRKSDLLKTVDGGATWNPVAGDGTTNGTDFSGISCADANHCIGSTISGRPLFRTENGGTTWAAVTASSQTLASVKFTSATHAIAVGAGGTLVVTDDAGATWNSVNSGAAGSFDQLHIDTSTSATMIGDLSKLARTVDSGASWKQITPVTSNEIVDATFPTTTRGYVVDTKGDLTRSNDGGVSWTFLDSGSSRPKALYAPSEDVILLVGSKGVRRSANGGLNFSQTGSKSFRKTSLTAVDGAGSAVFVRNSKSIFLSKTGGRTWSTVKKPKKAKKITQLDMVDAKRGYLLDSTKELWQTTSGGKKWTRIETTGANTASSIAFGDFKTGYIADSTGRMLLTEDAGKSWARQYPFYEASSFRPALVAAFGAKSALLAIAGTNTVYSTDTAGRIGVNSKLTLKASTTRARKGSTVRVTGRLTPAQGNEQVAVLARVVGATGGTKWTQLVRTVSIGGTFTTSWKITKPTVIIARWSGDASHDGDGTTALKISVSKKKR